MLRTKDMNTKLLDGLEMFLGVFVTSLNSSNLQMAGDGIYIGHQVERAIRNQWPLFYVVSDRPTGTH